MQSPPPPPPLPPSNRWPTRAVPPHTNARSLGRRQALPVSISLVVAVGVPLRKPRADQPGQGLVLAKTEAKAAELPLERPRGDLLELAPAISWDFK